MTCQKCHRPLLAQTRLCWTCGEDQLAVNATSSVEVMELGEPARAARIVDVLAALLDEPRAAVELVVSQPPFEISSATPSHLDRLTHWLLLLGVRFRPPDQLERQPGWRFRFRGDRLLALKFLAIAGVGCAGLWGETPMVWWAAIAMGAFSVVQAIEPRPTGLHVDPLKASDRLELLDPLLTEELVRNRRALSDVQAIGAVGHFLAEYIQVVGVLRATGDHLGAGVGHTTDLRLRQLLREALLMAGEAQRCTEAEASATALAPERLPKVRKLRADVLRHLEQVTAGLTGARSQAAGLPRSEAVAALGVSVAALGTLVNRLREEAKSW